MVYCMGSNYWATEAASRSQRGPRTPAINGWSRILTSQSRRAWIARFVKEIANSAKCEPEKMLRYVVDFRKPSFFFQGGFGSKVHLVIICLEKNKFNSFLSDFAFAFEKRENRACCPINQWPRSIYQVNLSFLSVYPRCP